MESRYTLTQSRFSLLIVSFLSPILSGVADFSGSKKKVHAAIFNYIGSMGLVLACFFGIATPWRWGWRSVCMAANVGFWGSLVFYNAYLPEIAEPRDHDLISAKVFRKGI